MKRALGGADPPGPMMKPPQSKKPSPASQPLNKAVPPPVLKQRSPPVTGQDVKKLAQASQSAPSTKQHPQQQRPQQVPDKMQKTKSEASSAKSAPPAQSEPPKEESSFFGFGFGGVKDTSRSRSPSPQPSGSVTGKVFGFGSSIFSQASNLISSAAHDEDPTKSSAVQKDFTSAKASPIIPTDDSKSLPVKKDGDKKHEGTKQEQLSAGQQSDNLLKEKEKQLVGESSKATTQRKDAFTPGRLENSSEQPTKVEPKPVPSPVIKLPQGDKKAESHKPASQPNAEGQRQTSANPTDQQTPQQKVSKPQSTGQPQQQIPRSVDSPAKGAPQTQTEPQKQDSGLFSFSFGGVRDRSRSQSPSSQPEDSVSNKVLGFGSSIFSSASSFISSAVQDESTNKQAGDSKDPITETKLVDSKQIDKKPENKMPEETKQPALSATKSSAIPQPANKDKPLATPQSKDTIAGISPQKKQTPPSTYLSSVEANKQPSSTKTGPAQRTTPSDHKLADDKKVDNQLGPAAPKQSIASSPVKQPPIHEASQRPQQPTPSAAASPKKAVPPPSDPPKQDSGFFGFGFGGSSRSQSPSSQAQSSVSGKVLGFGSSLFSSASTLIASTVEESTDKQPTGIKDSVSSSKISSDTKPPIKSDDKVEQPVFTGNKQKDKKTEVSVNTSPKPQGQIQQKDTAIPSSPSKQTTTSVQAKGTGAPNVAPRLSEDIRVQQPAKLEANPSQSPLKLQTPPQKHNEESPVRTVSDEPKQESGFLGFGFGKPSSASTQSSETVSGKVFGFGSSILSSASNFVNSAVQSESTTTAPSSPRKDTVLQASPKKPASEPKPTTVQKEEKPSVTPQSKASTVASIAKAPDMQRQMENKSQHNKNEDREQMIKKQEIRMEVDRKQDNTNMEGIKQQPLDVIKKVPEQNKEIPNTIPESKDSFTTGAQQSKEIAQSVQPSKAVPKAQLGNNRSEDKKSQDHDTKPEKITERESVKNEVSGKSNVNPTQSKQVPQDPKPSQQQLQHPIPKPAVPSTKSVSSARSEPPKQESGFFGFGFGGASRSRSPSPQPPGSVSGKVLGFGSSIFSSASSFISSAVQDEPSSVQKETVPPPTEQKGAVPPPSQQKTAVPPRTGQKGAVSPLTERNAAAPRTSQEKGAVPPAPRQMGIVPAPPGQKEAIPPHQEEKGAVAPPSQQKAAVPPPSGQKNPLLPGQQGAIPPEQKAAAPPTSQEKGTDKLPPGKKGAFPTPSVQKPAVLPQSREKVAVPLATEQKGTAPQTSEQNRGVAPPGQKGPVPPPAKEQKGADDVKTDARELEKQTNVSSPIKTSADATVKKQKELLEKTVEKPQEHKPKVLTQEDKRPQEKISQERKLDDMVKKTQKTERKNEEAKGKKKTTEDKETSGVSSIMTADKEPQAKTSLAPLNKDSTTSPSGKEDVPPSASPQRKERVHTTPQVTNKDSEKTATQNKTIAPGVRQPPPQMPDPQKILENPQQKTPSTSDLPVKAKPQIEAEPPKQESSFFGFGFGTAKDALKSQSTSAGAVSGKVIGFGSSIFSSASNLISSTAQEKPSEKQPVVQKGPAQSQVTPKHDLAVDQKSETIVITKKIEGDEPEKNVSKPRQDEKSVKKNLDENIVEKKMKEQEHEKTEKNEDVLNKLIENTEKRKEDQKKDDKIKSQEIKSEANKDIKTTVKDAKSEGEGIEKEKETKTDQTNPQINKPEAHKLVVDRKPIKNMNQKDETFDNAKPREEEVKPSTVAKSPSNTSQPLQFQSSTHHQNTVSTDVTEKAKLPSGSVQTTKTDSSEPVPSTKVSNPQKSTQGQKPSEALKTQVQKSITVTKGADMKPLIQNPSPQKSTQQQVPSKPIQQDLKGPDKHPAQPQPEPPKQDSGFFGFSFGGAKDRSRSQSPSTQPADVSGKVLGFGSSIFSSASSFISSAVKDETTATNASTQKEPPAQPGKQSVGDSKQVTAKKLDSARPDEEKEKKSGSKVDEIKTVHGKLDDKNPEETVVAPGKAVQNPGLKTTMAKMTTPASPQKSVPPSVQQEGILEPTKPISKSLDQKLSHAENDGKKSQDIPIIAETKPLTVAPDKQPQNPKQEPANSQKTPAGTTSPAKVQPVPPKQETSFFGFGFGGGKEAPKSPSASKPDPVAGMLFGFGGAKDTSRSRSTSPQATGSSPGKMFGFGSSLLSSATNLISSAVQDEASTIPTAQNESLPVQASPKKVGKTPSVIQDEKQNLQLQNQTSSTERKASLLSSPTSSPALSRTSKSSCPLCKVDLNKGSKEAPNYNTCTECKIVVCNLCGFNPVPHLTEVRLSVQTTNKRHYFKFKAFHLHSSAQRHSPFIAIVIGSTTKLFFLVELIVLWFTLHCVCLFVCMCYSILIFRL